MARKEINYVPQDPEGAAMAFTEPEVAYAVKRPDVAADVFSELGRVYGFTQQEWAGILHISDRTLQRYLRDAKPFSGMHAEVLFYLKKLHEAARQVFESDAEFVQWLRSPKQVLGHTLDIAALQSISGIRLLHDELGRVAFGVYI